jgi:hypothetical protein
MVAASQSSRAAGVAVLGGQAVVHAHDHGPGAAGEDPARTVMGVDVADDPTASVEEGDDGGGGRRRGGAGSEDAEPEGSPRTGDGPVLGLLLGIAGGRRVEETEPGPEELAEGDGGNGGEVDGISGGELVEDQLGLGFDRHGCLLRVGGQGLGERRRTQSS